MPAFAVNFEQRPGHSGLQGRPFFLTVAAISLEVGLRKKISPPDGFQRGSSPPSDEICHFSPELGKDCA